MQSSSPSNIVVMLLFLALLTTGISVQGDIVLEEDFDGGNLDDWVFTGYYWDSESVWWSTEPGITTENGRLTAPESDRLNGTHFAYCNSTSIYGTWSFDWTSDDDGDSYDIFAFILHDNITNYQYDGYKEEDLRVEGYSILIDAQDSTVIRLLEYLGNDADEFTNTTQVKNLSERLDGTHHFDITRDMNGTISVYLDSEYLFSHTSLSTPQSNKLAWGSWTGASSIDNIQIDDELLLSIPARSIINKPTPPMIYFTVSLIILAGAWFTYSFIPLRKYYYSGKAKLLNHLNNRHYQDLIAPIFEGKMSLYYFLLSGQSKSTHKGSTFEVPAEIYDFKFILHPIRLSILKLLNDYPRMTSIELKHNLKVSWNDLKNHLKILEERVYVVTGKQFVDGSVKKVVEITNLGIQEFITFKELIIKFLNETQHIDSYYEGNLSDINPNILYPSPE